MKILFIITRADTVGGAQVHVKYLAMALQDIGHRVQVLTGEKGKFTDTLEKLSIDVISSSVLRRSIHLIDDLKAFREILEIITNNSPDMVSLHSSKAGILGRLACYFSHQKPCIFTAHGWAFTEGVPRLKQAIYKIVEKLIEPLASKIICVSEYDRTLGIAAGMNSNRLVAIHNGMPDIPSCLRADPGQSNPVRLIMIARMDTQKDHSTLIQAIQTIDNIKLQLVGDGPNQEIIRNQVEELDLTDYVDFLGYRSEIADILAKAQVFLLISNWEGFPRATLEAMRAGLPVIVSDVGGASEAVIEGKTGYYVPKGDVEILRQRILHLVNHAELRQQMGQEARKHYEQNFTFDQMFQKTLAVYESVLANQKR